MCLEKRGLKRCLFFSSFAEGLMAICRRTIHPKQERKSNEIMGTIRIFNNNSFLTGETTAKNDDNLVWTKEFGHLCRRNSLEGRGGGESCK